MLQRNKMDIKLPEKVDYDLSEELPDFMEMLAIRETQGRFAGQYSQLDSSALPVAYSVCIRAASPSSPQLVAFAQVIAQSEQYLHVQDFIVRPEYQQFGLAKILLERIMVYVDSVAQTGTKVGVKVQGEAEQLCLQCGFISVPCADLGPNLIKTYG